MNKNNSPFLESLFRLLAQRNWQFVSGAAIFLILFEAFELLHKNEPFNDPFHWVELLIYILLLILVGLLVGYLVKANAAQKHTMQILDYKHNVSLDLMNLENLDKLTSELVNLTRSIANADASRLYIYNPILERLELASSWYESDLKDKDFHGDCQKCLEMDSDIVSQVNICNPAHLDAAIDQVNAQEFCLSIYYGKSITALLRIKLKPGESLSETQKEIFENITPEIAAAIKIKQEQRMLSEMRLAKSTMAERRTISTFIHDQLGQNLGYLHLKLDQLSNSEDLKELNEIQTEIKRLRGVANDSYEIVRDILKKFQSETIPHFTNLIQEHARTISSRANFELDFKTIGSPVPLLPVAQQSIFSTFCEALSNVEKHSNASKVSVMVLWKDEILDIEVADNGKGFEPGLSLSADHFGLQIMRERMADLHGYLDINSSSDSGTIVSISIPYNSIMVKSNEHSK